MAGPPGAPPRKGPRDPVTSFLTALPRQLTRAVVGIWRRRWLVLSVAWLVAAAGWLAVMAMPDSYQSRAQVYINTDTAIEQSTAELGSRTNLEKTVRVVRTQLLSRDNLERVVYDVGLDADIEGRVGLERRLAALEDAIEVRSREDQYFEITYADVDPVMAQRVVSSVLDLFIEQNVGAALEDVDSGLAALDVQIEARGAELREVEEQIASYRTQNATELSGTSRFERRLDAKEAELARVQDQIARLQASRSSLRAELSALPRTTAGGEIDELKLALAQLRAQYTERHPDIPRLQARIAELEAGGASLPDNPDFVAAERQMSAITNELFALQRQERRVVSEIDQLELSAAQTPEAEADLTRLLRERTQIEEVYDALRDQRDQMALRADINAAAGGIRYERYEAPRVAAEPSWPPRGLFAVGVLFAALGAGAGLAFLLTQIDKSYTQASDLEEALGLPVLGAVSPSPTRASRTRAFGDRMALSATLGALVLIAAGLFYWWEVRVDEGGPVPSLADAATGTLR